MTPAQKLADLIAAARPPRPKASKYRNVPTIAEGIRFDSRREAARWSELRMMERAGLICQLERQPRYVLAPAVKFEGASRTKPALTYAADFSYVEVKGNLLHHIVEDVKGVETESFRIKRHLMLSLHGIDVRIVK